MLNRNLTVTILAIDGIEPTRAEIYILTHTKRKDGRPLDDESSKTVEMMQEKLNSGETSNQRPHGSVAWEGDVYSQVLGTDKSGYVGGLGLGLTPSLLLGNESSLGNIDANMSIEAVQRLEKEINELKEKHDEEMNLMKQNQSMLLSEVSFLRQVMEKLIPEGSFEPQNFNGNSFGQVPDANSGHG